MALAGRPVGEMGEYLPGALSRSRLAGVSSQMEHVGRFFGAVLGQLDLSPLWAVALVVSTQEETVGDP